MTVVQSVPEGHVEGHPIERRMVRFEWGHTPAHWVPEDPFASHVMNVLHLLLPPGERWFIDVVNRVRPLVQDEELQASIQPFVQQESWHAQAHAVVLGHLESQGIDSKPFTDRLEAMFSGWLGAEHGSWPGPLQRWWARRNVAVVAAIEHFTAVLGHWILVNQGVEAAGADPEMLDLLRWHGAEEVEHRALVFDVHRAIGGRSIQRATTMMIVAPMLAGWWIAGLRFLMRNDPAYLGSGPRWRDYMRAAKQCRLPSWRELLGGVPNYLRSSYNPSQEFSTELALSYLARSPAAQAASARKAEAQPARAVGQGPR
jgi:hypothetical protein